MESKLIEQKEEIKVKRVKKVKKAKKGYKLNKLKFIRFISVTIIVLFGIFQLMGTLMNFSIEEFQNDPLAILEEYEFSKVERTITEGETIWGVQNRLLNEKGIRDEVNMNKLIYALQELNQKSSGEVSVGDTYIFVE